MLDLIKQLRQETGAGVVDAKSAIEEAGGNPEQALSILRKKGIAKAAKKAERSTSEGTIGTYVHSNGKLAALVALACESDFVARTPDFQELAHELAMQVAAASPLYVRSEDVPQEVLEKEKEVYRAELARSKKPETIWNKIIEGKLQKYYAEVCLVKQPFIKDDKKTVGELLAEATAKLGENIQVKGFTRFSL